MGNFLVKGILSAITIKLLDNYRHLSIQLLKIEAAKSYLHGVRIARQSALSLMQMGLVIGLICVGALLFHAGLLVLLPWTLKAKAVFVMLLGIVYVVGGSLLLRKAMDERVWIEKSGAAEMLKEATGQST